MIRLQRHVWFMAALACSAMLAAPLSAQTLKNTAMPVMANRVLPIANPQVKPLPPGAGGAAPKARALPDLQVGVIKISPQHPGEGQTVKFEGNIMNYGDGPAPNPVVTLTVIYPDRESDKSNNQVQGSFFVRLPHHDKYSAAPKVKCSNNRTFYDWEQCNSMH
jgi:hypothetical protein